MSPRPHRIGLGLTSAALLLLAQTSAAVPAITNGDFEAGFAGWTIVDQAGSSGSWYLDTPGSTTPLSGFPTSANGGEPHGARYAVSDQFGPGSHVLVQSFTIGPSPGVTLRWDMFVNNWDGPPVGTGLDRTVVPTQIGRVDILSAAAGAFDVGAGVLQNCFIGGPNVGNPHNFATQFCDISATVGAGGTFQLRFAETDNQNFFNMGIDNVGLMIPEPGTLLLLGAGLAGLGYTRRKR